MSSRMHIYNHWGELEQTMEVTTTPRGWVLNGYGRCDFAVGLSDANCDERLLRYGNFVLIEHFPNESEERTVYGKLPDWVGMIVPPRTWNKDAVVVSAVSAEALLAFRAMPYAKVEGTVSSCFSAILQYAKDRAPNGLPISIGTVGSPSGGTTTADGTRTALQYSDELRTNAYDHINKLVKFSGMDWNVTPSVSPSSYALTLKANLYPRLQSAGPALTPQNTDNTDPVMVEQGTIANHIFAYNQANTPLTRIMQEITLQDSIDKYGHFQTNTIYVGVTDSAGLLAAAAQARVNERGEPVKIVKRVALDNLDTFKNLAVGNSCWITDPNVGFNADGTRGFQVYARILSVDYNDMTNKCALNLELLSRVRG
jgi:hypothetical protein